MGKDKKQKKNQEEKKWADDPEKSSLLEASIDKKQPDSKVEKKSSKSQQLALSTPDEKAKPSNVSGDESGDSEIEIITLEQQGKKRRKEKKSFKGGFDLLDIEGDDLDEPKDDLMEDDDSLSSSVSKKKSGKESAAKSEAKSGKKSKKKERKKKGDDDDEDIEKLLEELALEMGGAKPSEKPKNAEADAAEPKTDITEPTAEVKEAKEEVLEKQSKKKKKKKNEEPHLDDAEGKEPSPDVPDDTDGTAQEGPTVKTAAQKKKEKKEKEKQKKAAQFEQLSSAKKKTDPEVSKTVSAAKTEPVINEPVETEDALAEEKKEEDDVDDKKKKKKKKGEEDDKKGDKKRPGKKQIAAMQEALRKVKEEEERLRQEEEARILAAEEAERIKEEKARLEQEKKDKRKQKEKEKRERLKAEGKLLTKTQRQNRARMEVTLAALREQGVEVPQVGEKTKRGPRLGDRKRLPKKKSSIQETESAAPKLEPELNDSLPDAKELSPEVEGESVEKEPSVASDDEDNIKEAWDETSEEEDSETQKTVTAVHASTNSTLKTRKHSTQSEESSESEDDSDEEGDEDSDSSSSSDSEGKVEETTPTEAIKLRIQKRRELAESKRSLDKLRSPVVCVLGHVDTGKTKILDKIRSTHVQDGEAGGITQQIGATMVPHDALKEQCKMVKSFTEMELKVPGLLIIDTPGHESFSNLRSRGSSLCDIAILVVDITHGLEPQTIESINMLKQRKTPFVVALNKIDRVYEWKAMKNKDVQDTIKSQSKSTKQFFDDRVKHIILEFANQSLNAVLYYENKDPRSYISMVPTSALTGDGMGNLMSLIIELTQSMMAKRLMFSEDLQATVLEVKAIGGLGHTMDVILVNGRLKEGDTIVFAGYDGAMTAQIRSLLMPQPLKELRVKTQFIEHREIEASQGIKITGKDLEKAIAGLPILVPRRADEIPILMEEISVLFKETMNSIKVTNVGVYVQASTLGSLEALMEFLTGSKIPVCGVRIGPVTKKDVMKSSVMLEHGPEFAVILAFDVKIEKEAQDLADSSNIKIFHANIIYHLFDMYVKYTAELKEKDREQFKHEAVFPCKLRILPQFIFNSRDPIVVGIVVENGIVKEGTPLCVPSKEFLDIGTVTSVEVNHKQIESARKGQEVCIKIEPSGGEAPKMFGRHFDHTDLLVSKISRRSIDMCKKHFRDDLQKTDWQLMLELKNLFAIL